MVLNGDEFLNVKVGERKIEDLTAACPDADPILINWKLFGSCGHRDIGDDLMKKRFVNAEPDDHIAKGKLTAFKPLFRTRSFKRAGIHLPKLPLIKNPRLSNGSGLAEGAFRRRSWRSTDPGGRRLAQINHYIVRDM